MTQSRCDRVGESTDVDERTESERYRLLASQQRRLALEHLAGQTAPVELSALASAIVTRADDLDHEDVERVTVSLHHVHLPMLDQFGVLEYDANATRIESCPSPADVRALTTL